MNKLLTGLGCALAFAACATGDLQDRYKRFGEGPGSQVGYEDFEVRPGVFYVSYQGGGGGWSLEPDSATLVTQFFHRRAREVCAERGFTDYRVTDQQEGSRGHSGGVSAITVPLANGMSAVVPTSGSAGHPRVGGYVQCAR